MPRSLLDLANRVASHAKIRRRARLPEGAVKVNLGSALVVAPGWINVDGSLNALLAGAPHWLLRTAYRVSGSRFLLSEEEYCRILSEHRFVHHNFEAPLPFGDATIDYVFSSHLLEHLFLEDARFLLREIRRALKPGGWVRIGVPDLSYVLKLFQRQETRQALAYFFSDAREGYFNQHHYMYDVETLRAELTDAGFATVTRRGFRDGVVPDLDILDNREHETLFVEAQPASSP